MMIECPQCHSTQRQTRAGRTRAGSQRYFCTACLKTYTPVGKVQGHASQLRQQAVTMCLEGISRNKVARLLQVAPQSVSNWCQAAQERLVASGQTPLPEEAALSCNIIEMDELHTFVGAKHGQKNNSSTL
jgi:transposase-like protein